MRIVCNLERPSELSWRARHGRKKKWPLVATSKPYSTVSDAMKENCNPGYNTLIVRMARPRLRDLTNASRLVETVADHLVVNYNFAQVKDILQGRHMHSVGAFATATCSCKSKSQVVTNFALRPAALKNLEQSGYGIHAIAPCAPSLGLALIGRVQFNEEGVWQDTPEPVTLYDTKPAPFQKFSQRLQTFRAPTLSIVARCTCFNTYIVSVMPYTASYFGLSTTDLNLLRQQAVTFLLKRHWLESEILPYVLRYLGIAPVLDPALVATVAATGLYFREGNTLEDLVNMDLLPEGCNLRQRSVVHDLLQFWSPFVKLPELYASLANRGGGLKGRLSRLKHTIFQGMTIAARSRVKRKIIEEGWSRGITPEWVELTSSLKKKWCNGVAKYTILRWAVNQDDDIWLTKRGTRHGQRCSHCSSQGDSFPAGHTGLPICERCIQAHRITPAKYCPFGEDLLQACHTHFHTRQVSEGPQATENQESNAMSQFQQARSRPAGSCVACGCGDNTIGHWTRWCIIPFAVVWIILQPSSVVQCLSDLAVTSPIHNAICTLTLAAFRRLLRQEGAFYHQNPNEPKSICWWIDMLLSAVSQDAPQELEVPFFRTTRYTPRCKVDSNAIAIFEFYLWILTPCTSPRLFAPFKKMGLLVTLWLSSRLNPCTLLLYVSCSDTRRKWNRMSLCKSCTARVENIMFKLSLSSQV